MTTQAYSAAGSFLFPAASYLQRLRPIKLKTSDHTLGSALSAPRFLCAFSSNDAEASRQNAGQETVSAISFEN
jgi:hypothetical protein